MQSNLFMGRQSHAYACMPYKGCGWYQKGADWKILKSKQGEHKRGHIQLTKLKDK